MNKERLTSRKFIAWICWLGIAAVTLGVTLRAMSYSVYVQAANVGALTLLRDLCLYVVGVFVLITGIYIGANVWQAVKGNGKIEPEPPTP